MSIVTLKATPVTPYTGTTQPLGSGTPTQAQAVQVFRWAAQTPLAGDYDIGSVWLDPPGVYTSSGVVNNFLNPQSNPTVTLGSTTVLPNPIFAPTLGMIVTAYEQTLGWGEFIALRIPTSTAVPVGTIVQWDDQYVIAAAVTGGKTGSPLAVAVSSASVSSGTPVAATDGSGTASNSTNAMYAWFQCSGRAWTLKTAVQVTPAAAIYASGTAGRFYVTASTGKGYIGARAAPATTTSTQSTALVYLNRPNCMTGP